MRYWLAIFVLSALLSGCPLDSSDSGSDPRGSFSILNEMTPTGLDSDGVTFDSIRGSSSAGHTGFIRNFSEPVEFGDSVTLDMPRGQCDVFWDLHPRSDEQASFDDFTTQVFLPCGETVTCTAQMESASGLTYSAIECE